MTIVDAFKKFFLKLNGQEPAGNTIAEIIRNGSDNVQLNNESTQEAARASIVLSSSTEDSTKKFNVTVDDSGTITATEIVAEAE